MTLIEHILKTLKPELDRMIQTSIEHIEKEQKHPVSKFEAEWIRLSLIYDMTRALEHYTLPTDKLKEISTQRSSKGSLTIDAVIERNGDEYPFYTEVIFAGGYNIQRLHYRYLTKTRLPQTRNDTLTKQLKAKLQKLSKGERLQKDIDSLQNQINRAEADLEKYSRYSEKDIIKYELSKMDYDPFDITWDDIVKRGVAKNYNNSEAEFNKSQKDFYDRRIASFKSIKINGEIRRIASLKDTLKKTQTKLNSLV